MHFKDMDALLAWLDGLGLFHVELGLGRMRAALGLLGLEKPPFYVAQVLGTNGKGSTSSFLASLSESAGCPVGLYLSPHFVSPKERILVNGRQADDSAWLDGANLVMEKTGHLGLTYFEFLTLLALVIFSRSGVRLAVLEAGLGGKNDATSAVAAQTHCFAPIAMDHAAIIGPDIADIARDKASAIKMQSHVFHAPQFPAVLEILRRAAREAGAHILPAGEAPKTRLGLAGAHQGANAALALAAWRRISADMNMPEGDWRRGLSEAFLPGRMQKVPAGAGHPALLLDGAHNPHGLQALARFLAGLETDSGTGAATFAMPDAVIFSALADKDWRPSLARLLRIFNDRPFFIPELGNERAASAHELASFCGTGRAAPFTGPDALSEALAAAKKRSPLGTALMTGSLYLLGEFFSLYPQYLHKSSEVKNS